MLKDKLVSILENVVREEDMDKIVNEYTIANYWSIAFTQKSADTERNNSTFAVYGINVMLFSFAQSMKINSMQTRLLS